MKFKSPFRHAEYVVKAEYKEVINGIPQRHVGVRAIFENGKFDSEVAQRSYRWSDQTREEVEQYLLMHQDFGHKIFPGDDAATPEELASYAQTGASALTAADSQVRCIATFDTPDGAEPCGRPVVSGSDYCSIHVPAHQDDELETVGD